MKPLGLTTAVVPSDAAPWIKLRLLCAISCAMCCPCPHSLVASCFLLVIVISSLVITGHWELEPSVCLLGPVPGVGVMAKRPQGLLDVRTLSARMAVLRSCALDI
jgi:hypothetical protein